MKKKVIFSETTTGKNPLLKADRIIYIEGGEIGWKLLVFL